MSARRHNERWLRDFTAMVVAMLAAAAVLLGFSASAQGAPPEGGVSAVDPTAFPDGSESAPSITNLGDTNTGAWFCAADAVCISTGGTERFRLTTTTLTLTVPLLYPAGTAAAPSIGWAADADGSGTGFYRPGANEITAVLNGVARLMLSSNQVDPGADNTSDFGQTARRWRAGYAYTLNASSDLMAPSVRDLSNNQKHFFSTVSGNVWSNQAAGTVTTAFSIENSNAMTTGMLARFRSGGANHVEVMANELRTVDGVYLTAGDNNAGAPAGTDCDADSERGRLSIDTTNNRLYVCNGATRGWDYAALTD